MFYEADLQEAFVVSRPEAYLYLCTGRIFTRFLDATNRLVQIEHTDPHSLLRRRYIRYLTDLRGFSEESLQQHGRTVADFLSRGLPAGRCLSALAAADVESFVQLKSKENSRQSLQHIVAQS